MLCAVALIIALNSAQSALWGEARKTGFILGGSGVNIPLTKLLAQAFTAKNAEIQLKVLPSIGTTGGVKAVHKGKIDLGLASRALSGTETTWGLKAVPYAKAILVFAVNPSVSEDNITNDDVLAIYDGKKNRWKNGSAIIVLMREEGDSGAELLTSKIPGIKETFQRAWHSGIWRIEYRDTDCARSIERLKNSIGWSDFGSIQIDHYNIKPLKFNGIEPNISNAVSGSYPLSRKLTFIFTEPLPEPLRKFIAFVKSPEGLEIVRKYGYVPIP